MSLPRHWASLTPRRNFVPRIGLRSFAVTILLSLDSEERLTRGAVILSSV
jgi:hypothetical protein